jgi:Putative DNA-binding domain
MFGFGGIRCNSALYDWLVEMILKRLEDITENDISSLISNQVREGRTIDYKRELPGGTDANKKEFLADVSSFSNTSGGDLIIGLDEDQGVPTQITGFQSRDVDGELLRLENIIASGLEPRIRYKAHIVICRDDKKVMIFRMERSWSGPHRVIFQENDKFWGRNSSGKYRLDVNELRNAFTLSSTVTERIRAFRVDRTIALSSNQTPVPLKPGPKLALHCIPVESFAGQPEYELTPIFNDLGRLPPMEPSNYSRRYNLEGLVVSNGSANYIGSSYTQLYRNGIIEAVDSTHLGFEIQGMRLISSVNYERRLINYLSTCFALLKSMGVNVPIVVALTFTDMKGLRMPIGDSGYHFGTPIDRDLLILPETMVQDFSMPAEKILKPMFDLVWNASGFSGSQNFDDRGDWIPRRG